MPVPKGNLAAICTIEKANAIFNNLVEENRLDEVLFFDWYNTNSAAARLGGGGRAAYGFCPFIGHC
jgi:hypothetical protein